MTGLRGFCPNTTARVGIFRRMDMRRQTGQGLEALAEVCILREMGVLKHFLKVIGAGVCIGILLAVLRTVFRIDSAVFWRGYWIAGAAVVFGAALLYVLYTRRYAKRIRAATVYLENGEPRVYLDEMEDMLRTARGRNLRATLEINRSVGYYEMGEYNSAISVLEKMPPESLRGEAKMVYRLNLCLYYFRVSRNAEAIELYRSGETEFARYREKRYYSGSITLLDILAAIEEGRYNNAKTMFAYARETWQYPRMQKEYQMIEKKLAARR